MRKPYFVAQAGAPEPLRYRVERLVRFEEVDSMAIAWHGRYVSYFEDGRVALGAAYGVGYLDYFGRGVLTPIKKLQVDYHMPLRFQDSITIEAILHYTDAARINYEFAIYNHAGQLTTSGFSVQLMLDTEHRLLLTPPPFHQEFMERWRQGLVAPVAPMQRSQEGTP